jgi:hypothetical protein
MLSQIGIQAVGKQGTASSRRPALWLTRPSSASALGCRWREPMRFLLAVTCRSIAFPMARLPTCTFHDRCGTLAQAATADPGHSDLQLHGVSSSQPQTL